MQVACVYGDLADCLSRRAIIGGGWIDIVDVLPIQLENLRGKLPVGAPARLLAMDSMNLKLPGASYDRALVFFLLHEQLREWRERTLSEALRGSSWAARRVIIVDYARPRSADIRLRDPLPATTGEVEPVRSRSAGGRNHHVAAGMSEANANKRLSSAGTSSDSRWAGVIGERAALSAACVLHLRSLIGK